MSLTGLRRLTDSCGTEKVAMTLRGSPCWYHRDRTGDGRRVQSHLGTPPVPAFRRPDCQDQAMPGHVGQPKFTVGGTSTVTSHLLCVPSQPVTRCRRGEWDEP